jgi:hypothetical protein
MNCGLLLRQADVVPDESFSMNFEAFTVVMFDVEIFWVAMSCNVVR